LRRRGYAATAAGRASIRARMKGTRLQASSARLGQREQPRAVGTAETRGRVSEGDQEKGGPMCGSERSGMRARKVPGSAVKVHSLAKDEARGFRFAERRGKQASKLISRSGGGASFDEFRVQN
jgi:hypothetical protein